LQKLQVDITNTRVILYGSSLHYIKAKPFTPCLLFFGTYVLHFKLNRSLRVHFNRRPGWINRRYATDNMR